MTAVTPAPAVAVVGLLAAQKETQWLATARKGAAAVVVVVEAAGRREGGGSRRGEDPAVSKASLPGATAVVVAGGGGGGGEAGVWVGAGALEGALLGLLLVGRVL